MTIEDYDVITVARGVAETNAQLRSAEGWRLVGPPQLVEELIQLGPPRQARWVVMSTLGRKLNPFESAATVAADADAQAEESLATANVAPVVIADEAPAPAPAPEPVVEQQPVRIGQKRIKQGAGEFEATGIKA